MGGRLPEGEAFLPAHLQLTGEIDMFEVNEGRWDRGIRIALGLALMGAGFGGVVGGGAGLVIGIFGLVPLITGLVGWCPLYSLLGLDTRPAAKTGR